MVNYIFIILILLSLILIFFLLKRNHSKDILISKLESKNTFINEQYINLESENTEIKLQNNTLSEQIELYKDKKNILEKEYIKINSALTEKMSILEKYISDIKLKYENAIIEKNILIKNNAALEKSEEFQNNYKEEFKNVFENIAQSIVKKQSLDFSMQSSEYLKKIIDPLKNVIEKYENDHKTTHLEFNKINTINKKMQQDLLTQIDKLHNTLKYDNKMQGQWGELILDNILKSFGFKKDREYFLQYTLASKGIVDVLLKIPHNDDQDLAIIIDSKVSIKHYDAYINYEENKTQNIKKHIDSIKNHIKLLSDKNYNSIFNQENTNYIFAPFIIMFVPIEDALNIAVQNYKELFNFAWEKNILLVSQTQLTMSLFIFRCIFETTRQNLNNKNIIYEFKKIYKNLERFITDFDKLGSEIHKIQSRYNEIYKRIMSDRKGIGIQNAINKLPVDQDVNQIIESDIYKNNINDNIKNLKDLGV